jgi:hypothetical protein
MQVVGAGATPTLLTYFTKVMRRLRHYWKWMTLLIFGLTQTPVSTTVSSAIRFSMSVESLQRLEGLCAAWR